MESNPQLELAFDFLEYTGVNLFLTGKAGTGKTTFLHKLKRLSPKRMVVLAPTGVAAINAGGMTIHSFFQLPFGPYVPGLTKTTIETDKRSFSNKFSRDKINVIRSIDLLVIDEISMVRADLLDAVDDVLRRYRDRSLPFGGVQLLLIGDMQQLAPVAKEDEWAMLSEHYESPYFFHSKALKETPYVTIELKQVYRQQEGVFLELLNRIRENQVNKEVINALNQRYIPGFSPGREESFIVLTTHNWQARQINERKMAELPSSSFTFRAEVKDEFPSWAFPTDEELVLKEGAQVMFVRNDSSPEKQYYNGKIGVVTAIGRETIEVKGKDDDLRILVGREEWTNTKYTINPETREIVETVEGTFTQYPLKSAWAITIHKSQGLTFDKAIIDVHAAFAHGQVYVALSRCRTFEGLVLSAPINATSLIKDANIDRFNRDIGENTPDRTDWTLHRKEFAQRLLQEQFDFSVLYRRFNYAYRLISEHLYRIYPEFVQAYRDADGQMRIEVSEVSERFKMQLQRLCATVDDPETDPVLKERVAKGCEYFDECLIRIAGGLIEEGMPEIDNKEGRKAVSKAMEELSAEYKVKTATLNVTKTGFTIKKFLTARSEARVELPEKKSKTRKEKSAAPTTKQVVAAAGVLHPQLYETLRSWRKAEADSLKLPAYTVLHQRALVGIVNTLPTTARELLAIPGIGKKIIERYGKQLLELVDQYRFAGQDF